MSSVALDSLRQLTNLVQLKLHGHSYSKPSMQHCLACLSQLQDLELARCTVAPILFEACPQLTRLCVDGTAGVKSARAAVPVAACLAALTQLKELQLKSMLLSQLTNTLTATTGLTQLILCNVGAPGKEGCINISHLIDLKLLDISFSKDIICEHVPPNVQVRSMCCCG